MVARVISCLGKKPSSIWGNRRDCVSKNQHRASSAGP
ncbi:predicted protein [Botrytis cinerea T4]|uniref:Uncharacterized protein n=1 Tax=Botryotinia fuckeliana (strain T4) TaxID=999810 RepID=G2YQC6_BOTF4|nr:predicted protein [Botrytis cinerea T4]